MTTDPAATVGLSHVPDLDSLELLLQVAGTGSFGRAAAAHGVSQPAVSARVAAMEGLVGFPLVERSARGSSLTAQGALVADWARDVLQAASALATGIASLRADRDARLRVAASLTVAEYLVPRWLVRFAADHPDTAVSLAAVNSSAVEESVLAGDADLGFVEGPRVAAALGSAVVAVDRLVVVVPPGHPWARRRRPLTGQELVATRMVHREPASGTRTAFVAAVARFGAPAVPVMELSTTSAVRSAVLAGAGPAVLSTMAVENDVAANRLVVVPVADVDLSRQLRAVWPRGRRPAGPAGDLLRIAGRSERSAGRPADRVAARPERGPRTPAASAT
ncbi:LysR family transcriptional regulator [Nakamurella endophytica]|uniref:Transcriptional regulator n=1 Tax=Nakamurella endophytica TaxID=1748367 RepID=A0A917WD52_9ACTN|nr:LysR family transcriptional regulator [Nakamurella endophytica]GGL94274.1 transcriptional regulator [Nakamurella endophytica]